MPERCEVCRGREHSSYQEATRWPHEPTEVDMMEHPKTVEELVEKHPDILGEASVSIADGWIPLVDRLCDKLRDTGGAKATQVKEKFGGLRFYASVQDEAQWALIDAAEEESRNLCEDCGAFGTLREDRYWMRTLCDEHA